MLSIVIPVLNEVDSLRPLHAELAEVARQQSYELDIVFVDDGSTDGSWLAIQALSSEDPRVRGIRLRRNFGKAAALNAGVDIARGALIVTLDADLQDDPLEIPKFLSAIELDLDVVSGWKKVRHDPWHKVFCSRVFNWMVSWLTGVHLHDHNCGFKCYRREVFDEVRLYGELHRFVPVLAGSHGFRIGELVVHHRPREHGRSKYGVSRIPGAFLDLLTVKFLTGFSQRPQHLMGTLGLIFFAIGGVGLTYLTGLWVYTRMPRVGLEPEHLTERAMFFYSIIALLLGVHLMSIGFLAELITAYHRRKVKPYSTAERTPTHSDTTGGPDGSGNPSRPFDGTGETPRSDD